MSMSPPLRKLALTTHLAVAVGWPGSVAAYLALALTGLLSTDTETVRATYLAMDLVALYVIVPLAFATLVSGLVMSLGTPWGLFRHYWVVISLILTLVAVAVLMVQLAPIRGLADAARDPNLTLAQLPGAGSQVLHSAAGLVVLLVVLVLNVYKPRGMTRYGRRLRKTT